MMTVQKLSNALFNAYDIRSTIKAHNLCDIRREHDGTENADTLKDLIDDVVLFLEELEDE